MRRPQEGFEPAKGSALDIPAEPLAGYQYLLARSARLEGPPGGRLNIPYQRTAGAGLANRPASIGVFGWSSLTLIVICM